MALTKEQLLAEVEDVIRTAPPLESFYKRQPEAAEWFGRFSAVIRAWDFKRSVEVEFVHQQLENFHNVDHGAQRGMALLHEARHTLRIETVGHLSVAVAHGQVFDYFDEVRKVIETAKQDLLFVDPYLDAAFVSNYLGHVLPGVIVRLLAREKLTTLLPAVDAFANQSKLTIQVRSAPGFHDRYVFVDHTVCYQSGASFKDGAKSAPTTLTQITDAFKAMAQTYEDIWLKAKVER
jgi:hypothetical protein